MKTPVKQFLQFVQKSPTAFHAVRNMELMLQEKGFVHISETDNTPIVRGGKYYVTRNQSSLIAFSIPQAGFGSFQVTASHTDSPTFKLKANFEEVAAEKYLRLNVEGYGGMLMSTWLDRPLSIAGRVVVRNERGLSSQLVDLDHDMVVIPSVPIHMNREANDGYKWNIQKDLLPLYGTSSSKGSLKNEISDCLGVKPEQMIAHELYLYCRTPGSIWGDKKAFFSCTRIDNLECAFTTLLGFMDAEDNGCIHVYASFDNEEVGSGTRQGADSTFLSDTLERIGESLGVTRLQMRQAVASGFMVSADNAHSVHPNHPELYDADNHAYMNEGIVIKHSANQKYTTDAISDAAFTEICNKAGVPVQHFANRSDVRGGSTLGNISDAHVSISTVDIGLAQLAMHSAYETAGTDDLQYMIKAINTMYSHPMRITDDTISL